VVTKNSGGAMTRAKLHAARDLGVEVVMIQRPALPPGVTVVGTVDEAQAWVLSRDNAAE
jgi:precorrin-6A/cobalt-precorrin-6A reductase